MNCELIYEFTRQVHPPKYIMQRIHETPQVFKNLSDFVENESS